MERATESRSVSICRPIGAVAEALPDRPRGKLNFKIATGVYDRGFADEMSGHAQHAPVL
jgi:hypothetical protein